MRRTPKIDPATALRLRELLRQGEWSRALDIAVELQHLAADHAIWSAWCAKGINGAEWTSLVRAGVARLNQIVGGRQ
jgi:hypothetical protein